MSIVNIYPEETELANFMLIRRLSENVWMFETYSLIDIGLEIELKKEAAREIEQTRMGVKSLNVIIGFTPEEIYDLTVPCYTNEEIGKIIFSGKFDVKRLSYDEKLGVKIYKMDAGGISSKFTEPAFSSSSYSNSKDSRYLMSKDVVIKDIGKAGSPPYRLYLDLAIPIQPGETRAIRLRIKTRDVPYVIRRGFLSRSYIYDIRFYGIREYPSLVDKLEEPGKVPIEKLFVFVIPKKGLIRSEHFPERGAHYVRKLETDEWNRYLKVVGNYRVEDGRLVYRGRFGDSEHPVSSDNKVRLYYEFTEPPSIMVVRAITPIAILQILNIVLILMIMGVIELGLLANLLGALWSKIVVISSVAGVLLGLAQLYGYLSDLSRYLRKKLSSFRTSR